MRTTEQHKQRAEQARPPFRIAGIGEVLWDHFPTGKRLGGAPLNFCYHCQQFGAKSYPISSVGTDLAGDELLRALEARGIPRDYVFRSDAHPTGKVDIRIDTTGIHAFTIHRNTAWEHLTRRPAIDTLAPQIDALCFGTLGLLNPVTRLTLKHFLMSVPDTAWIIFDINLRQQLYNKASILESLEACHVLKISDDELPQLVEMLAIHGSTEAQLLRIMHRFNLKLIAYTRGANGSLLITPEARHEHSGIDVTAVNTVGAGDSFTATLCIGLLAGVPLQEINESANHVGAFVCTQDSATPTLPEALLKRISDSQ